MAVLTLAAGAGTRWTKGAGTVKALNPFCRIGGAHRTFIETHLAKSRHTKGSAQRLPHIISTSYLTHDAIKDFLEAEHYYGYEGEVFLSPGSIVGLRLVPTVRDLRFAWMEMPQQLLDEQAQKVLESLHNALMEWAQRSGEAGDYTDNLPLQCLHPVGHWYEIPNLFRNGVLSDCLPPPAAEAHLRPQHRHDGGQPRPGNPGPSHPYRGGDDRGGHHPLAGRSGRRARKPMGGSG